LSQMLKTGMRLVTREEYREFLRNHEFVEIENVKTQQGVASPHLRLLQNSPRTPIHLQKTRKRRRPNQTKTKPKMVVATTNTTRQKTHTNQPTNQNTPS